MSAEQMDRACSNLKNTEKRQGQLQKQRAKALAQLQAAEERGVATDQLGLLQNTVSDVDRAITDLKGAVKMHRQKIFNLKQQRAAEKALKKLVKQQSVASDGDLIPAGHAAVSATATAEVACSKVKEALSVVDMALFFAGVGCVMTFGTVGFITKKLRLW